MDIEVEDDIEDFDILSDEDEEEEGVDLVVVNNQALEKRRLGVQLSPLSTTSMSPTSSSSPLPNLPNKAIHQDIEKAAGELSLSERVSLVPKDNELISTPAPIPTPAVSVAVKVVQKEKEKEPEEDDLFETVLETSSEPLRSREDLQDTSSNRAKTQSFSAVEQELQGDQNRTSDDYIRSRSISTVNNTNEDDRNRDRDRDRRRRRSERKSIRRPNKNETSDSWGISYPSKEDDLRVSCLTRDAGSRDEYHATASSTTSSVDGGDGEIRPRLSHRGSRLLSNPGKVAPMDSMSRKDSRASSSTGDYAGESRSSFATIDVPMGDNLVMYQSDNIQHATVLDSFCSNIAASSHLNVVRFAQGADPKILCASSDSTVHVYRLRDGSLLRALEGHTDRVVSLAVSNPFYSKANPNMLKTLVASGSRDEYLRIWDLEQGKCLHTIHAHKSTIWAVAIAVRRNGDVIIMSTAGDGTMRSWNGRTGRKLHTFKGHSEKVLSVTIYDPTGTNPLVFSGGSDRQIRAWDLLTGHHIRLFEGHEDEVHSVAVEGFTGSNALQPIAEDEVKETSETYDKSVVIVSASKDLSVRVWDFKTGHMLFALLGHNRTVYDIGISRVPDNYVQRDPKDIAPGTPLIISSGDDGTIKLWNLLNGKLVRTTRWHRVNIRSMDLQSFLYQPNNEKSNGNAQSVSLIASCGWDKTVQVHSISEALEIKEKGCCHIS